jgi:4-oxalocrotonate tautomerase
MYSGKSQREKDRLADATTEDEVKILKVSKEEVIVLSTEATHGNRYSASVRL